MKDPERVGQSFQNQQPQNQELAAELEEQGKDAEELANLVQTKSEAIKTLQTKLVDAKRTIAELKATAYENRALITFGAVTRSTFMIWGLSLLRYLITSQLLLTGNLNVQRTKILTHHNNLSRHQES